MTKRMLIDDTQPEETRVVVVNGNKLEDVEFESSLRKQIKGNVYIAKVMRVEPSLQAAFVDYGGNKHGFLAFGEIHPDYYNVSEEDMAAIDKEVEDTIEAKKQAIKDREIERERVREERAALQAKLEIERQKTLEEAKRLKEINVESGTECVAEENSESAEEVNSEENQPKNQKRRLTKKRFKRQRTDKHVNPEEIKVLAEATGTEEEIIAEEVNTIPSRNSNTYSNLAEEDLSDDDDDDEQECDFEMQKKLLKVRKLFHRSRIQDVVKEGQILLIQVVKEERGNKGAALTTYLSLAGRYCVLMPNRIKSGGVSRKITNASDRKRLKGIVKELPLSTDMSMIVRTAGEEKTQADIVRDYNYLMRSWNQIRLGALQTKAPALIHEEGNLIKRALRDMYTKEISEIIVDGEQAYRTARDFVKILSPHNLKKIKFCKSNEMPLFQRFQVEGQLDKLHDTTVQLESGGYLVINPTEALVSIDVNSGRATKEKDLEETALKTNLEAADEIAKQLRMRNLAGLVVVDFIDMEEQKNNMAVEKRIKEAMKKDRARIQVAKMSIFGLLEISRQRMHSSFMESNYQVCPHCHGKGMVRTTESGAVLLLRSIEEEGIKGRSSRINVYVPSDVAIYLLNQKRPTLCSLEQRYKMEIIISADDSIKNIADFRIERTKAIKVSEEVKTTEDTEAKPLENRPNENRNNDNRQRQDRRNPNRRNNYNNNNNNRVEEKAVEAVVAVEEVQVQTEVVATENVDNVENNNNTNNSNNNNNRGRRDRRNRFDRNGRRNRNNRYNNENGEAGEQNRNHHEPREKSETVILYNSHEDIKSGGNNSEDSNNPNKKGNGWWKKLIKG